MLEKDQNTRISWTELKAYIEPSVPELVNEEKSQHVTPNQRNEENTPRKEKERKQGDSGIYRNSSSSGSSSTFEDKENLRFLVRVRGILGRILRVKRGTKYLVAFSAL
jgi:hypothetical protein